MSKPLNISSLAKISGVKLETIRFYERSGLLPEPPRSTAGYRQYQPADIKRLRFIRRGRELGFSLEEIRSLLALSEQPQSPCASADALVKQHLADVEERLRDLRKLRNELSKLTHCHSENAEHCQLLEALDARHCCQ